MSYRIEYGPEFPKKYRKNNQVSRVKAFTAAFLLLFTILVRSFFPAGTEKLRQLILPPEASLVQTGFDDFLSSMRSGKPMGDAFTVFCKQIVSHEEALLRQGYHIMAGVFSRLLHAADFTFGVVDIRHPGRVSS